jgi:hypothetical protein
MCETAANWVGGLLPEIPYRQWVLSFDSSLAIRLGYDAQALTIVCRSWARRVMQRIAWRVKQEHGPVSVKTLHPGLITVVQRFRADCGLYVHLHTLATDGAFEELPGGDVRFHPIESLTPEDLLEVGKRVAADLAKAGVTDDIADDLDLDPAVSACVQLSLSSTSPASTVAVVPHLLVSTHGMNLHAATVVDGRDRRRLERVCKYLLRPPFALDAVHRLPDGRVRLDLPRKGRCVVMTPEQFIAKLVSLVPPPHFNLVRYAGVFANRHHLRTQIVPTARGPLADAAPLQLGLFDVQSKARRPYEPGESPSVDPVRMPRRSWSWLLAHVFAIDITHCPRRGCGGRLEIVRVVRDPDGIASVLHGARAPPRPAPPGQLALLPS